jgi:WhiB family redox-sensing transcriptional regulator
MNAWAHAAACRGTDQSLFFPSTRGNANAAVAQQICTRCTVKAECLEHALSKPEQHGVWGGLTEAERHTLKRGRKQQPQPTCGSERGYRAHIRRGETPCGACIEGRSRDRALRYQERQKTA